MALGLAIGIVAYLLIGAWVALVFCGAWAVSGRAGRGQR